MADQQPKLAIKSPSFIRTGKQRALAPIGLLFVTALLLSGCDGTAPETRLEAAGEALDSSTSELAELNTRIEETVKLHDELLDARRALKDEVRTLEQRVALRATDVAIFRAVQSALLDEPGLNDSAIAVSVEDGAVVLTGRVQADEKRRQAIDVAQRTTGVEGVIARIVIDNPETARPGGNNKD